MKSIRWTAAFLAICLCASTADSEQLSYGPDSVVDGHPSAWYIEPAIAVSPKDARRLIAGSMVFGLGGLTAETFRSDDGGYNWRSTTLPLASGSLLGDVQAAFSADGRAYMTVLGSELDPSGKTLNGLYVFGSLDAGETFQRLAFLQTPDKHGYDHEQLAIDRSGSPYRGRIYMSVLYGVRIEPQVNALGMLWSSDGGRTFHGPVRVWTGWSFNCRPVVLADGTVIFPFFHIKKIDDTLQSVEASISHDGGRSFSTRSLIGTRATYSGASIQQHFARGDFAFDLDSVPQFAAGLAPNGDGAEIYGVWSDLRSGVSHLLFVRSDDMGRHWTKPQLILSGSDGTEAQYQPSIEVNGSGVVGLSWFGASRSKGTMSEMFAISNDGGRSFSAPASVSSVAARIQPPGGDGYTAQAFPDALGTFIAFTSPLRRYSSGGDYMGLVADGAGAFHPIWIDARNGAAQVWTATAFANAPNPEPAALKGRPLTDLTTLEFGLGTWDAGSQSFTVPVRLHNASQKVLYPPFTVTVTKTQNPYLKEQPSLKQFAPPIMILNADNRKTGIGATFTYSANTLGNLGRLSPGADTASRMWRVRIPSNSFNPLLVTSVTGYLTP